MEEHYKYKTMHLWEFYEFLARLAFLAYPDPEEDLTVKLYRILLSLFKAIGVDQVKERELDNDIDSESDYEDNIADKYFSDKYPSEVYCGYGLSCRDK
jgi:hypothetical protein